MNQPARGLISLVLVARKSLVEMLRELQLLALTLLMPLLFLLITKAMYVNDLLVTHPLLLIAPPTPTSASEGNQAIIQALESQRYPNGRDTFKIEKASDRHSAESALEDRSATLLVILEEDQANQEPEITVVGDALNPRFYRASTILDTMLYRYNDRITGRPQVVEIAEKPLSAASPQNEFDLYAPGMMIFAILMIIPQTAMLVAREIRWKTLRRLSLTRLSTWQLLGGISLAQMVVALVQVLMMFFSALALGFNNHGSLGTAILVGLVVSLSAIGMGLVVACFSENDSQAANVGSTLTMIQVFLSGSFYQLPPLTLFTLAGHQIDVFDIFPATHGFHALQQVFCYGTGFREISFRLGAALFLAALYFVIEVVLFNRLKARHPV
jgi:ABC-2 type transport system permease protein